MDTPSHLSYDSSTSYDLLEDDEGSSRHSPAPRKITIQTNSSRNVFNDPIMQLVTNEALDQQRRDEQKMKNAPSTKEKPALHSRDRTITILPFEANSLQESKLLKELTSLILEEDLKARKNQRSNIQSKELIFERTDSSFVVKFLRGCKYNKQIAYEKIRNYQMWRNKMNLVNQMLNAFQLRDVLETGFCTILPHPDVQGRVILYFVLARLDFDKFSIEDYTKALYYILERAMESPDAQINGMQVIQEFEGFSWIDSVKISEIESTLVDMAMSRLPIRLSGSWGFHEPFLVKAFWKAAKVFIKKKIADRVQFLGSETSALTFITTNTNIPVELGGQLNLNYHHWVESLIESESEILHLSFQNPQKPDVFLNGVVFRITKLNFLVVKSIAPNCLMSEYGLQVGDCLISINDNPVKNTKDLDLKLYRESPLIDLVVSRVVRDMFGRRLLGYSCSVVKDFANNKFRNKMEDQFTMIDKFDEAGNMSFFAVYDGHGGDSVAKYLASNLHKSLYNEIKNNNTLTKQTIEKIFLQVDQTVPSNQPHDCGATAVIAIVLKDPNTRKRFLHVANIGDARAVLCCAGRAERLSFDHKATEEKEQQRIINSKGFVMRDRVGGILSVSRSFGDASLKLWVISNPYQTELLLTEQMTFLILASDGLWDVMTDQEAVDLVLYGNNPKVMAASLVQCALSRGSTDNITVSIIIF